MRVWNKYILVNGKEGCETSGIDSAYADHARSMNGYGPDEAYVSREAFYAKYYSDYHFNRLTYYDKFIRENLKYKEQILSIASGRCANELRLIEDNYDVVCSDLEICPSYEASKKIFPEYRYLKYDVLNGPPSGGRYNAIICLSLIYLFDDNEFNTFLANVRSGLNDKGVLILDSAGPPDNYISYIYHELVLKYEKMLSRNVYSIIKGVNKPTLIKKKHGYRRSDEDIVIAAEKIGFKLLAKNKYGFDIEFQRSGMLRRFIKWMPFGDKLLLPFGKMFPYIRMFIFEKT